MTTAETILICLLIPACYVITYMAGYYDIIGELIRSMAEKASPKGEEEQGGEEESK